jgi:hypothetical protein
MEAPCNAPVKVLVRELFKDPTLFPWLEQEDLCSHWLQANVLRMCRFIFDESFGVNLINGVKAYNCGSTTSSGTIGTRRKI